jgi:hypothetical protein
MSKHKGDDRRGKPAQQQPGQAANQNRDGRRPQDGGAHERGAQQDRQRGQEPGRPPSGEQNR